MDGDLYHPFISPKKIGKRVKSVVGVKCMPQNIAGKSQSAVFELRLRLSSFCVFCEA